MINIRHTIAVNSFPPGAAYASVNWVSIGSDTDLAPMHWNGNVVILMKFSSLAALKVVKMTTSSAANDENFIKMMTFPFQCAAPSHYPNQCWLIVNWILAYEQTYEQTVKFEWKYNTFHSGGDELI